jgi:hypothetical protein
VFGLLSCGSLAILIMHALSLNAAGQIAQLRAQIAADAAALVAVHEGEEAARTLAVVNGAELAEFTWVGERGDVAQVRVRVNSYERIALATTATFAP